MTEARRNPSSPERRPSMLLASDSSAFWGSIGGAGAGVVLLGFGLYLLFAATTPATLDIALVIFGAAQMAAGYFALHRRRVAWAFSISLNLTAFVVFLFSSAKIRDTAEISIGVALVPSLLFGVIVLLQFLGSEDY